MKWFLIVASIQRHFCEDFFGQHVWFFLIEIRLLKGKCTFLSCWWTIFQSWRKQKARFSKPKEMFSRRCLYIKTSLWRFVRSTCVIFLTEIRLLKGKRAFSNKNKTKQNRSGSIRKLFLAIASIQRHPWEDFFGQHVIFFHKNQAPQRKNVHF